MPTPTEVLREEHRVILRALGVLEAAAAMARAIHPSAAGWISQIPPALAACSRRRAATDLST